MHTSEGWLQVRRAAERSIKMACLGMLRWAFSSARAREQLTHSLKKRKVQFEWDDQPATKASGGTWRDPTNKNRAEETHPEE